MLIQYKKIRMNSELMSIVATANVIIDEYQKQGFDLTLRQLYYQFVARGYIANSQAEYKRLGTIINKGRLAGLISWTSIVDRTRNLEKNSHWDSPAEIVETCAKSYQIDKWANQPTRVEVWIEKDALAGVIENVCRRNDVSYFSCRGYTSQSEMWSAAMRLAQYVKDGQDVTILHLGDHDPSGIDMSRDIGARLRLFMGRAAPKLIVRRIALTMAQVQQYSPPPNPAKLTDRRAQSYIQKYGPSSWELDALDPSALDALIDGHIKKLRDNALWNLKIGVEKRDRSKLTKVAKTL